jgi:DNA-binding PadR family transcriptional regulator
MRRLDYCLLGLIAQGDCSGYDIRKVLTQTPMRRYSDSPGSIYPALERLRQLALVRSVSDPASPRRRTSYQLTGAGRRALARWLGKPVTSDDLARGLDEVMLRLSFQHLAVDRSSLRRFLRTLARAANARAETLRTYLRGTVAYPESALLALGAGLNTFVSLAQWAASASQVRRSRARPGYPRRAKP